MSASVQAAGLNLKYSSALFPEIFNAKTKGKMFPKRKSSVQATPLMIDNIGSLPMKDFGSRNTAQWRVFLEWERIKKALREDYFKSLTSRTHRVGKMARSASESVNGDQGVPHMKTTDPLLKKQQYIQQRKMQAKQYNEQ